MDEERRKFIRVETPEMIANCRVLGVDAPGEYKFTVWPVKNMSLGGLGVNSEEKMSKESLAYLNIDFDEFKETISVIAKVMWCRSRKMDYDLGLSFSWWPKQIHKKLLENFVEDNVLSRNYEGVGKIRIVDIKEDKEIAEDENEK